MEYNFGSYPTMITPCTADGKVDFETAKKYVRWYAENNCHGIFSVCQSSEIFFLDADERAELNRVVYDETQKVARETGKKMTIVSSGHVSEKLEDQAYELNKIYESGTDALILITSRLDLNNEGDDVWLRNAEKLLKMLPEDVGLGIYECPFGYKRLATPRIFKWCRDTGRFYFMKDTCCDIEEIERRLEILKGSDFKIMNANCQTLLASLRAGCGGYSGIMANFHPKLYAWLCDNFDKEPEKAELVQSIIGTFGFTECGQPYPLTAKYNMNLCGIHTEIYARHVPAEKLTKYHRDAVEQMKHATDWLEAYLGI